MGDTVNQRTRLTRRLFHESLLSLLKEKSVDKITVKELCERAELNRTTFYLHYGQPADVLGEIEDELVAEAQTYLKELKEDTAITRLRALLAYIRDNRDMFRTVMCESGTDAFRYRFFESVFPEEVMSGLLLHEQKLKKYIEGYLTSGAFAVVYTWILDDCALPADELADLMFGLSKNAVSYLNG